ncbi:MAG: hypothetical protein CL944_03075 [Candidatus Diapherotrites archaeon]|uniref:Uncharacterized protein n=1 Tax=Candidatus Iainarchaeum sp. TaxID=3101447 RepID=A0A2D6LQG4_9ARCH|nr:hypothetical protein [Candidatus Diapherotrites archaeon]|tara:strand:+ start:5254 stop:6189 length:936 start_codon:yes stop_codon:yes gene_type:complete
MDEKMQKTLVNVLILVVLLFGLLVVLIFTGILGCNSVPFGCDAYYTILKGGQPSILIAYGANGLGNYEKLEAVLSDRSLVNARARAMSIDKLSQGNVNDFDLIIVEEAKQICSDKLKMFQNYVIKGGRLIWTADAGTELCEEDSYLLESEREVDGEEVPIGPWARRDGSKQLSFDEFLGVNFKGNVCDLTECTPGEEIGRIEVLDDEHKLTYGLSPSIPYSGNFSVVKTNSSGTTTIVSIIDYGFDFLATPSGQPWLSEERTNFGKNLPFIITSGVGERVAYYAAPIESFVEGEQPYKAMIEQLYYGMLYN